MQQKQKCSHLVHVPKAPKANVEEEQVEDVVDVPELPSKHQVVGKAFESMKRFVSGNTEPVSPMKEGARPFPTFQSPINHAEIVIKVHRPESSQSRTVKTSSVILVAPSSNMRPPPSSITSGHSYPSPVPSTLSFCPSVSSLRDMASEYELLSLRQELSESQEELLLYKRKYSAYKEVTDNYIESMYRRLGDPSGDSEGDGLKGKGKGRVL